MTLQGPPKVVQILMCHPVRVLTFICHLNWAETLGLKGLEPNTFMKHSFYNKYAVHTKLKELFFKTHMCIMCNAPSKMRSTSSERDGYYVHFCLQWKSSKTS